MSPAPAEPVAESTAPSVDGLTEAQVLDRVGECARTWQRMGAELLALAYEWAIAHPADRLDPAESGKPGREKAKLYGGEGTPEVTEFAAAATFGARMGRGTHAGRRHIAAALDLKLRLPNLWSRVQALEVRDTYAIHVAEATRTLSAAEAAWVDGEVAESADGRIPWTRFQSLVAGKVTAAAPHLAREREERAARARFAKKLTPLPGDQAAGMATFMIRAPLPIVDALDAAITTLASRIEQTLPASVTEAEDAPTTDDLRVQAVALLAGGLATGDGSDAGADVPDRRDLAELDLRDLLPQTTLVVHLYGGTSHTDPDTGEQITVPPGRDHDETGQPLDHVARIEGHGAVSETWLREVLGPHAHVQVLPVLDIDGLAPVDAYEVPTRHRRAVQLRHPVETFPWGTAVSTSSHVQLDHEEPWQPPGPEQPPGAAHPREQTRVDNLGPLHTFHHRLKTHGGWQVREPFPGIHLWRDPHGHTYLRDATGTRALPRTPGEVPRRTAATVVEIYPGRAVELAGDLGPAGWVA